MTKTPILFISSNGISTVRGFLYTGDTPPKALLSLSHGMAEHMGRYEEFISFLIHKGYAVSAHDHIGHGISVGEEDTLGFFALEEGPSHLIKDLYTMGQKAKEKLPPVPHFLLGHSMGSLIARLTVTAYPEEYEGLILSGTLGPNPLAKVSAPLIRFLKRKNGERTPSPFLDKLLFGSHTKKIDNPKTDKDWLSRDSHKVKAYIEDPFSSFLFTTKGYEDLITLSIEANGKDTFKNTPPLPILLISGDMDPVGNYGKGVRFVYDQFQGEHHDVKMILYPGGRHEMLNETNREEVYEDILHWLNIHSDFLLSS